VVGCVRYRALRGALIVLPGKKYQPEDLLRIARRRVWVIVTPLVMLTIATGVLSRFLPNRYRSETLIMVVPQRVPETYVKATVTSRIEDRLQSISQQILSRTHLERIIQDFGLYAAQRKNGIMENVVNRMRRDIDVEVVKGDTFRISYSSDSAQTAMKVTEQLATLFIDENLKDREVLANGTNEFLEAQLGDARQKLVAQEKKLEAYRKQFTGQLPSQLQSNLQALQNTQMQIQAVVDSVSHERDRQLMLQRLLSEPEPVAADSAPVEATPDAAPPVGSTADQQLDAARKTLAALELRLTADHPDVRREKRIIADLEQKTAAQRAAKPSETTAEAPRVVSAQDAARIARTREMRAELESVTRQVAMKDAEEQRLRAEATRLQTRIDAVPTRESELAELTRDYETIQKVYRDLLAKQQDSQVAANLERRQIGEQFKVLDAARLPEKPFSPNRRLIGAAGMAGGLALGLALVLLLEYRDRSFRSQDDVEVVLSLTVLATVPIMCTEEDKRRSRRNQFVAWASAAACASVTAAAVAWKFRSVIEGWVR
jgi:polysaccharide chain length determinant protein (PEP-CTERM system associated)